ncbi:MAG: type II secretion system major pseudopilin GspG [Pirellulales bacterium]|nr:type II secretion system major pseudopilin GspG [Pirellulales bacterium]
MRRTRKRRGFTLMEMLVVLGILVLLLAMVAPRVLGTQKKADITTTKSQIELLKGCLDRYCLEMKTFPATEEGLAALVSQPTSTDGAVASRWDGPYTDSGELPLDAWGNPFQYEYPPTQGRGDYPDIWSYGPDGEDNTEDDIVSWKRTSGEEGEGTLEDDGLGTDADLGREMGSEFDLGPDPTAGRTTSPTAGRTASPTTGRAAGRTPEPNLSSPADGF